MTDKTRSDKLNRQLPMFINSFWKIDCHPKIFLGRVSTKRIQETAIIFDSDSEKLRYFSAGSIYSNGFEERQHRGPS